MRKCGWGVGRSGPVKRRRRPGCSSCSTRSTTAYRCSRSLPAGAGTGARSSAGPDRPRLRAHRHRLGGCNLLEAQGHSVDEPHHAWQGLSTENGAMRVSHPVCRPATAQITAVPRFFIPFRSADGDDSASEKLEGLGFRISRQRERHVGLARLGGVLSRRSRPRGDEMVERIESAIEVSGSDMSPGSAVTVHGAEQFASVHGLDRCVPGWRCSPTTGVTTSSERGTGLPGPGGL